MTSIKSQSAKLHRMPLAWLAAAILIAVIGACIFTIVLAQRYSDDSPSSGGSLLHIQP